MSLLLQPLHDTRSNWFVQSLSCGLGLCIALAGVNPAYASTLVHADSLQKSTTTENEPMDEVWELIRTADAHADAAEFDAAIKNYTQALKRLSGDPEWASQYNRVRRMLGEAHLGAYRISKDTVQLRKAKEFLRSYFDTLDETSKDRPETEALLQEIEHELKSVDEPVQAATNQAEDNSTEPERDKMVTSPPHAPSPNDYLPMSDRSKAMIISGAIVGGLGLVVAGLSGVAFAEYRRQQVRGERGVEKLWTQDQLDKVAARRDQMATLALVGGLSSGAMILTGAILIGVARSTHKKHRMAEIYPAILPEGIGLGWSGRF